MAGSGQDDKDMGYSPRTKGIIQHFVRTVKRHTEGLDEDLQMTNQKLGQLENAQIATNTKLGTLEAYVHRVDTSLAALLKRFDDLVDGSRDNRRR